MSLEEIKSADLYRRLRKQVDTSPTTATFDGRRATVFASNDYLGLRSHPAVLGAAARALEERGASAGASRLISGNHKLYDEVETKVAALKRKETALVFPTGYMANVGVLSSLVGPSDLLLMDKLNHASLYDGAKLSGAQLKRYRHADTGHLRALLDRETAYKGRFIVTDGVFSVDGDLAPLPELASIAANYGCTLIVDDAHGTGVFGPGGRGSGAHTGTHPTIEIGTFSKALGGLGGFVAGDRETIELLVNKARSFIFTTGLPPATLAGISAPLAILDTEPWRRERVLKLAAYVRSRLGETGFTLCDGDSPIIPIIIGDELEAVNFAEACLDAGLFIPAIRHPTVLKGRARLRLTVSAAHSDEEIETLLATLTKVAAERRLI